MSIKLPHKLAAWESQLRIFPEETALALGALVQKVAALLGPFPHHHVEGHVVPDGFAGLDKRGTYDRLIASDWVLADELPEEFMRRSVMGEHLFWKVAYRELSMLPNFTHKNNSTNVRFPCDTGSSSERSMSLSVSR